MITRKSGKLSMDFTLSSVQVKQRHNPKEKTPSATNMRVLMTCGRKNWTLLCQLKNLK